MQTPCLAALVLSGILAPAVPDLPREPIEFVQVKPSPLPESLEGMVLRALPRAARARGDLQIVYEVQAEKVGPVRFYPLVGPARLVQARYKCTVYSNAGVEVVYIDHEKLKPEKE
jgi:hypothetical protein